jgi:hypothetical protein
MSRNKFHPWDLWFSKISMLVLWIVTSCGLVSIYQRFGGTYFLHLQGRRSSPHDVTVQKTDIDNFHLVWSVLKKEGAIFILKTWFLLHVSPFAKDFWTLSRTAWWPGLVLLESSLLWKRRLGNSSRANREPLVPVDTVHPQRKPPSFHRSLWPILSHPDRHSPSPPPTTNLKGTRKFIYFIRTAQLRRGDNSSYS